MITTGFNQARLKEIRSFSTQQIDTNQFASVAWCISHGNKMVDQGLVGHADHARKIPIGDDAIYRLYSMTKPVVSVCCLQLIEAGALRLDSPVRQWLPLFSSQKVRVESGSSVSLTRPITVEDLLTHRAGFSYDFLPDCEVATQYREAGLAARGDRSLSELVNILAELPLAHQPGTCWYYSYATDVLAHLIEVICDKPLRACLRDALFDPLGMQETDFQVPQHQQHRLVAMHGQRDIGDVADGTESSNVLLPMDVESSYPSTGVDSFARGGLGLFSTLQDYRRFMGVLQHGRRPDGKVVLSAPMLDLLWRNRLKPEQMPIAIGGSSYPGYGWGLTGRVMTDMGQAVQLGEPGEGGWAGAASTYFWVDRRRDISGIVMSQYLGSAIPLGAQLQSLAYSAIVSDRQRITGSLNGG